MKISKLIPLAVLAGLLISHPSFGAGDEKLAWGENVGFVSAYVDRVDNDKGLTIHAAPSVESPALGHLAKGTRVLGCNTFKGGWVKLRGSKETAWVNLKFLKPIPFEGIVTKVDEKDLCLGIRAAPGPAREKVGCAQIGEPLKFTGVMTSDNWIQLADRRGWISASSVEMSLSASQPAPSGPRTPDVGSQASVQLPHAKKEPAPSSQQEKPKASVAEKRSGVMCTAGWCVDRAKAQATHDGKAVQNTDCFKNTVCAGIFGQHYVARAVLDGSITFGKFKLASTGAISTLKGDQVANCAESGGINHKCVAKFLSQMISGAGKGKEDSSAVKKTGASKEQIKKTTAQKTEPKKQPSAKSSGSKRESSGSRVEGSPFVNEDSAAEQDNLDKQMLEEAWEENKQRAPGF